MVNAPKPAVLEEPAQARLDRGGVRAATRAAPRPGAARRPRRSASSYSSTSASTRRRRPASTASTRSLTPQVFTDTPKRDLRLDLVALGHRDVAHVVAEAGEREVRSAWRPAAARAHRPTDAWTAGSADVADDRLARDAHAGLDVRELAVAVGGLVQVHEVHVDRRPRQRLVGLRVQVQQRLAERLEPADPHLRRRERVHPGDHADAAVVVAGVEAGPTDARRPW